jgi:hypothetical protein
VHAACSASDYLVRPRSARSVGRCSRGASIDHGIAVQQGFELGLELRKGIAVGWWLTGAAEVRWCSSEEGGGPMAWEVATLLRKPSGPARGKREGGGE